MKKNVKTIKISLKNTNNNYPKKNNQAKLNDGSNPSSKEKKSKQNIFIFNKKRLNKNVIPISNSKCFLKNNNNSINRPKIENNKQKEKTQNNSFSRKIKSDKKRQSLSLIKKNKNNPLRLSMQVKVTPEKNISFIQNKNRLNLPFNNNSLNSLRLQENNYIAKSKKISFFKDKNNNFKNSKEKAKETLIYHKKIDKINKLLWINKIKNNLINISCDNVKKNICYYKQIENNINKSQVIGTIKDNINLNINKETKMRNIYYPKSPVNKHIILKNNISPLKKVNFVPNKKNHEKITSDKNKIIKLNHDIKLFYSQNKMPNNYAYHEIIYKNSPKKVQQHKTIKEEEKYNYLKESQRIINQRNNRPLFEELTSQNNNYNRISTTILINNQSFNNLDNQLVFPYYCTLNSNKKLSLRSSFREDNYNTNNNKYLNSEDNFSNLMNKRKLFFSPQGKKLDISGQYNEIETENEDVQTIHYFGEEMRKKNKNYNFNKINEMYKFSIDEFKNTELKRNNSSNDIIDSQYNEQRNIFKSIPFSSSYNNYKWKKYNKRGDNLFGEVPIIKNNKRYNHNIINRKKKKKLIMEKSLNEQFISKKKNKSSENTKDKISICESSINLDNDSFNDIIREFEKEIEIEEKKDKINKNYSQNKCINNGGDNKGLIYSFVSENDNFSNMSKGSTNDSKIKIKKVRYYKTKNFDMEKNYDFFISPSKIRKNKK